MNLPKKVQSALFTGISLSLSRLKKKAPLPYVSAPGAFRPSLKGKTENRKYLESYKEKVRKSSRNPLNSDIGDKFPQPH